ncbi:hypothetical protein J6590_076601 [Homalodisca vitripennis]|nr:hypothetical protein J6590_076601 [Homalodisca vitripennis]
MTNHRLLNSNHYILLNVQQTVLYSGECSTDEERGYFGLIKKIRHTQDEMIKSLILLHCQNHGRCLSFPHMTATRSHPRPPPPHAKGSSQFVGTEIKQTMQSHLAL